MAQVDFQYFLAISLFQCQRDIEVDHNGQTEFSNAKYAFHLLVFTSSRVFGSDCL